MPETPRESCLAALIGEPRESARADLGEWPGESVRADLGEQVRSDLESALFKKASSFFDGDRPSNLLVDLKIPRAEVPDVSDGFSRSFLAGLVP